MTHPINRLLSQQEFRERCSSGVASQGLSYYPVRDTFPQPQPSGLYRAGMRDPVKDKASAGKREPRRRRHTDQLLTTAPSRGTQVNLV